MKGWQLTGELQTALEKAELVLIDSPASPPFRELPLYCQDDDSHYPPVAQALKDAIAAVDAVLSGNAVSKDQKGSVGCNIKWKRGNAPDYF